eukprot:858561-Prymnesium_polylepis.1
MKSPQPAQARAQKSPLAAGTFRGPHAAAIDDGLIAAFVMDTAGGSSRRQILPRSSSNCTAAGDASVR